MRQVLHIGHLLRVLAIVVAGVLLVACGSDEGDTSPTATTAAVDAPPTVETGSTSEQARVASPESTTPRVPANTDMSTVAMDASPVATPGTARTTGPATVSPAATATGPGATPAMASMPATPTASPVGGESAVAAAPTLGDGTTGAMVGGTPVASPAASPVAPQASPMAFPVAQATPGMPETVQGCDVANVPPFTGEQTQYRLIEDLNFRTGPGTDCPPALDQPIGAFQVVEVIGGPVVREGDDTQWVQIRVLDTEGWVAFEFLEPVEQ